MKVKLFLLLLSFVGVTSCATTKAERMLNELDGIVENRMDIYSRYEAGLQALKDSLAASVSDEEKWEYTDRLFYSYAYFSLDSTLEYVGKQKKYAATLRQELITAFHEIYVLMYRHNEVEAEDMFMSLDTLAIRNEQLMKDYYACGLELYIYMKGYSRHIPRELAEKREAHYRKLMLSVDTSSFYACKTMAQEARRMGDYDKALSILDSLALTETDTHNQALIAFNQASVYEMLHDRYGRLEALVRSVRYDMNSSVRTYLSLYELALMMYEENSLKRANLYISANMTDAIAGGFNTRMINAGTAQMIIAETARQEDRSRIVSLLVVVCCFLALLVMACVLLINNTRHSRRLKRIKNMLLEVNSKLKTTNSELQLANRIKDSYVFSYMELSIHYLEKLKGSRKEIRGIAKNEGLDAVLRYLRSPSDIYEEYRQYYKVFDEAFLGIFPDFREKVNAILDEEARFPIHDEPVLCTEQRLLAAIRLGIRESGKIATFLNCAPTTIYTYRTRLKRAALCSKDEFESIISSL